MQEQLVMSRTVTRGKRKKQKKKGKWRRFLFVSLMFLLLVGGGLGTYAYMQWNQLLDQITEDPYHIPGQEKPDPSYSSDKPLSFVILGRDTREHTGLMNTDVIIVAVANPITKKVTMVSLPRDTRVKIPGYRGYHKINAVYANGEAERRRAEINGEPVTENGITLMKKTLEQMLGIPIQHYVMVDFEGFKAVIDELGGVEVNVDRDLIYHDSTDGTAINLKAGLQTLNGEQALGFVRHRKDDRGYKYYSSDFDRNNRQQEVIKAIVDKMVSLDGLSKIFNVMKIGGKHIATDLSKQQITGLAYDFKGLRSSDLIKLENGAFWSAEASFTLIPQENLEKIRASLQAEMGVKPGSVALLSDAASDTYRPEGTPAKPKNQRPETEQPQKKAKKQASQPPKQTKPMPATVETAAPVDVEEKPVEEQPATNPNETGTEPTEPETQEPPVNQPTEPPVSPTDPTNPKAPTTDPPTTPVPQSTSNLNITRS